MTIQTYVEKFPFDNQMGKFTDIPASLLTEKQAVIACFNKQNKFVDDHNGGVVYDILETKPQLGLVMTSKPNGEVKNDIVMLHSHACLNPLYLDKEDGLVHLSVVSMFGGNIQDSEYGTQGKKVFENGTVVQIFKIV